MRNGGNKYVKGGFFCQQHDMVQLVSRPRGSIAPSPPHTRAEVFTVNVEAPLLLLLRAAAHARDEDWTGPNRRRQLNIFLFQFIYDGHLREIFSFGTRTTNREII